MSSSCGARSRPFQTSPRRLYDMHTFGEYGILCRTRIDLGREAAPVPAAVAGHFCYHVHTLFYSNGTVGHIFVPELLGSVSEGGKKQQT